MRQTRRFAPLICWLAVSCTTVPAAELKLVPESVVFRRPEAKEQVLIHVVESNGQVRDVTRDAVIELPQDSCAAAESGGLLRPTKDGSVEAVVRYGPHSAKLPIQVSGISVPAPVSFRYDIIPILTRARCNSGGCHGKAEGQNGFKLSVFGFDYESDHRAILSEGRGRRVSFSSPAESLLLKKGSAEIPHGGGLKLERGSDRYNLLFRWISEGGSQKADGETAVVGIEVYPRERVLTSKESQQLRVTALFADGSRRCVTRDADYESNAAGIAEVGENGLITATDVPGEAAILARYLDHVAICRVTLPRSTQPFARPAEKNFIDRLVFDKLERLGIEPSPLADDAMFIRRVYLDVIGTLPTPEESRRFLDSTDVAKRERLIAALFERREYVDYWTMRWSNLLRIDPATISPQSAVGMTRWLRRQLAENRPYNEMVRDILAAQGSTRADSPAAFYKSLDTPDKISRSVSQLFLGVRIECAQCHHHPSEKWGQEDYFALAGFFTGVTRKSLAAGGEAILSRGGTDLKHPRTGELVPARALGASPADFTSVADRRLVLAQWAAAPDNPYMTRTIVNRLWAHYFGRGLVEPIDDIRDTNPPSNEPLMNALCEHLREVNFDLRAFTRTLLESRVYQLSSIPTASNQDDSQNFSHAGHKALPAEVLLDMFTQCLGVPEKFNGWPLGYRSIELWDSRVPSYFFRVFGRPVRATVCECERSNEPSIAQALHLLNSPEISAKLQDRHGTARKLAQSSMTNEELIEELYLLTLSRIPNVEERRLMLEAFQGATDRAEGVEDILWALLNQKEFLYNR